MYTLKNYYIFRYDWYQTETYIVVTILIKNVKKEDYNANIQAKHVSEKKICSRLQAVIAILCFVFDSKPGIFIFMQR